MCFSLTEWNVLKSRKWSNQVVIRTFAHLSPASSWGHSWEFGPGNEILGFPITFKDERSVTDGSMIISKQFWGSFCVRHCSGLQEYKGEQNHSSYSQWAQSLVWRQAYVILFYFYLFIYFLAALGLCCCRRAFSSCSERGLLSVAARGLLIVVASLVAERGL